MTKEGVRGRDRRLPYFLGQAAERGAEGPVGQQPANGDQQRAEAGTRLTKGAATDAIISDSCRYNGAGRHRPGL